MLALSVSIPTDFPSLAALSAHLAANPTPWVKVTLEPGVHAGAQFDRSRCLDLTIQGGQDVVITPAGPDAGAAEGYGLLIHRIGCNVNDVRFETLTGGGYDAISYKGAAGSLLRCGVSGAWSIGIEADERSDLSVQLCELRPSSTGYGLASKHGSSVSQVDNLVEGLEQGGVRYGYGILARDNGIICGPKTTLQRLKVGVTADRDGMIMGDAGGTMRLYYCDIGAKLYGGNVTLPKLTCNTIRTLVKMDGGRAYLEGGSVADPGLSAANISEYVIDATGGEAFVLGSCSRTGSASHANRLREGAILHAKGSTFSGWPSLVDKDTHSQAFF